jgi:hypothetical protein
MLMPLILSGLSAEHISRPLGLFAGVGGGQDAHNNEKTPPTREPGLSFDA